MSKRYWISPTQLGMFLATAEIEDTEAIKELVNEIIDKQIIKCDICKKDKTQVTCECTDCYLKGCKLEIEKVHKLYKERVLRLKKEFCQKHFIGHKINEKIIDEIFGKELGDVE